MNESATYDREMRTTMEREVKLDADAGFTLPALPGDPLPARVFTSTYHDTPPRSLARAGITLRRRLENGRSLWQLKLPQTGASPTRAEIEAPGGPAAPPASLARLLVAHARHGKLEPVATLRTRRAGTRVTVDGRRLADVTVDSVDVLDAGRVAGRFTELEIELIDGADRDLERLARTLRRAGARRGPGTPKLLRVLPAPAPEQTASDATLDVHLRRFLSQQLAELEAHDPGARLGTDPEDVHKLRVATRRARALIRATRPLLGDRLAPLGDELRWLGGVLGPVRDLDVLLGHLANQVAALDVDERGGRELLRRLDTERDAVRAELLAALESERYVSLLAAFDRSISLVGAGDIDQDAAAVARVAVQRLRRAATRLTDEPSDGELHALRIRAKRARYAAELASFGGDARAARAVDRFKRVQDVIGVHQDAVVAEERLRRIARGAPALAAGRLIELERERRRAARRDYPSALAGALRAARRAFG